MYKNLLSISRDCFRWDYVVSWSSGLHQGLKALILDYLKGTYTFSHPLNDLCADNFISMWTGIWLMLNVPWYNWWHHHTHLGGFCRPGRCLCCAYHCLRSRWIRRHRYCRLWGRCWSAAKEGWLVAKHRPVSKNCVLNSSRYLPKHRPVSKNWGAQAYKLHYLYI